MAALDGSNISVTLDVISHTVLIRQRGISACLGHFRVSYLHWQLSCDGVSQCRKRSFCGMRLRDGVEL